MGRDASRSESMAGLIALEKTLPSYRVATFVTAGVLFGLGVLLLVAPDALPALIAPGEGPRLGIPSRTVLEYYPPHVTSYW